jgi:hypothetical protein
VKAPDFDELIDRDVPQAERDRLRRVHDLLIAAGPPPELPAALATPPVRAFSRKRAVAILLAAALAVAAFAAGWTLSTRNDDAFDVRQAVPMRATSNAPGASALIELGYPDTEGNWEMLVTVRGLKPLPKGGYYELLLTIDGNPVATCGSFKVRSAGATTVPLGAAYDLRRFDGWVIRPYIHGRDKFNKTVVLRTQNI